VLEKVGLGVKSKGEKERALRGWFGSSHTFYSKGLKTSCARAPGSWNALTSQWAGGFECGGARGHFISGAWPEFVRKKHGSSIDTGDGRGLDYICGAGNQWEG